MRDARCKTHDDTRVDHIASVVAAAAAPGPRLGGTAPWLAGAGPGQRVTVTAHDPVTR